MFLLSYVWIRYFVRKFWLALMLSALLSAAAYAIYVFFVRKKRSKNTLRLKEKEDAENMFLSLAFDNHPMDFFARLASLRHENVTKHKEYLIITYPKTDKNSTDINNAKNTAAKNTTSSKATTNTAANRTTKNKATTSNPATVLFADFSFEGLTVSRFMQIYNKVKKEKPTKIVVVCKSVDKSLPAFVTNFSEKILLLDEYQTYQSLYKLYECFPEISHRYAPAKKMALKDFMAFSFNKSRTKGYLFSALVLIISGLFIRPTIYYCIVASLLVVFALISQFNPYFNKTPSQEVL